MTASSEVTLREVADTDLDIFFEHQKDPDATRMAAFPARDRDAHLAHWRRILADEAVITRTVLYKGEVAGNIVSWEEKGEREIGYWIGKPFWGLGIATAAVTEFIEIVTVRPLVAHVPEHNVGSMRVLEKCGFVPAGADGDELVLRLET